MRPLLRGLLALGGCAFAACSSVPLSEGRFGCGSDADCPPGWLCAPADGRCYSSTDEFPTDGEGSESADSESATEETESATLDSETADSETADSETGGTESDSATATTDSETLDSESATEETESATLDSETATLPDGPCGPGTRLDCQGGDVWCVDGDGAFLSREEECLGGAQCVVLDAALAECQCALATYESCSPEGDVESFDSCGVSEGVVDDCEMAEVCDFPAVGDAECCAPTSDLGCDSSDAQQLFHLDSCGLVRGPATACSSCEYCTVLSPTAAECQPISHDAKRCATDGNIWWVDSCVVLEEMFEECPFMSICIDPAGSAEPYCS